jgi:AmmeMemoRadiSam system protein A
MSSIEILDDESGQSIVRLARRSLERFIRDNEHYSPDLSQVPAELQELRASFVTLTNRGRLRGCIGHTLARNPLAEDVAQNAAAAAQDFRFTSVEERELDEIRLEVTVLTPFQTVSYKDFDDLLGKLRIDIDGVMLSLGHKRALLLPQVWKRLPDPTQFLEAIAQKAGIPDQELKATPTTVQVQVFQAQHFAESGYLEPGN